jgi:hypothetical protein
MIKRSPLAAADFDPASDLWALDDAVADLSTPASADREE